MFLFFYCITINEFNNDDDDEEDEDNYEYEEFGAK